MSFYRELGEHEEAWISQSIGGRDLGNFHDHAWGTLAIVDNLRLDTQVRATPGLRR